MIAMLDTDVCVDLLRSPDRLPALRTVIATAPTPTRIDRIVLSTITLAELEEGVRLHAGGLAQRDLIRRFATWVAPVAFDGDAAARYGELLATTSYRARRIGPLDELIASHALALPAALVSGNGREFERVPGLVLLRWARSPGNAKGP